MTVSPETQAEGIPIEKPGYNSRADRATLAALRFIVDIGMRFNMGRAPTPVADRAILLLLRTYKLTLTRFTSPCSLEPSCSTFAMQQVRDNGWPLGLWVTLHRIDSQADYSGRMPRR